jgi:maltose/maltodextrin transport system substrate-binding protein/arabinogalactan oligomer/maltooligosaccharide transport system substrate-binding protein
MNLGKFEIIEEVGHGGFGTVYRANDTTLERIVALKILHQQYLSDQKFIQSFKREARLMARVSHPNVVQIFEIGDLESQIYIAMQYFDSGNLDQKIQTGGPLPLRDAIRMLSQTARGLEAGHKIGLVHRDVKPANILYNRDGYIAISDFGVAKSIQQSSPETTNSFNQFAGTPYYIPPELWKSEGNPSPAADIYSLACVFYEALTGEILFEGDTYEHVLTRHVLEAPVFSNSFPESLADTLSVALAKNPSDRYQTMNDFLAAVRGALERQPRKSVQANMTPEQTDLVEGLPRPLAPGEITFDELVRRSQYKSAPQSSSPKPETFSQPGPAPKKPVVRTTQPEAQKTKPGPESKAEAPATVPVIRPPRVKKQRPEPIATENPAHEKLETEPKVGLPGIVAEKSKEAEEATSPKEIQKDHDSTLENWLSSEPGDVEPAPSETPAPDAAEDAPQVSEEEAVAEEADKEIAVDRKNSTPDEKNNTKAIEIPLVEAEIQTTVEEIFSEKSDETPGDAEQISLNETAPEIGQSQAAREAIIIPAQETPVQAEAAEEILPGIPMIEAALRPEAAGVMTSGESKLKNGLAPGTTSEKPRVERRTKPAQHKPTQTLESREDLLAHNPVTSKFDHSQNTETGSETKKKTQLIPLLAFGGVLLIALAVLIFSGQARGLLGGKPSSTPTEVLVVTEPPVVESPTITSTEALVVMETLAVMEPTIAQVRTPTSVPFFEGENLRIWADDQRAPILTELGAQFQAEYNVEVIVENISGIRDQFLLAAPAGEGPDIIIIAHDQLPALITSGMVAELDLGAKAAEFEPESLQAFSSEGKLFGLPYARENLGFFYNADLVKVVPTTWQGVYDLSKTLIDNRKVQYGMVLGGSSYDAYPWMTSQGGYIFGQDADGDYVPSDLGVGSAGMIKFGMMAQQWKNERILSDNLDNSTARSMFLNGEVAFFMTGPWDINNLKTSGLNFGIAKFPDGGYPFLHVQGFAINALSENILLAQAFLTEMVATEDAMLALYNADPRVPTYLPAAAKIDDPYLRAIAEAGEDAKPMPAIPEMGAVWFDWGNALGYIFNGEMTPEQAYTFAQDSIVAAIGTNTTGMVNVPGSYQSLVGCASDWMPNCAQTALTLSDDGKYTGTFTIPAGFYECKVALDGYWNTNYGVDGIADGDNITFTVPTYGKVTFIYDPNTHLLNIQLP